MGVTSICDFSDKKLNFALKCVLKKPPCFACLQGCTLAQIFVVIYQYDYKIIIIMNSIIITSN